MESTINQIAEFGLRIRLCQGYGGQAANFPNLGRAIAECGFYPFQRFNVSTL